MTDWTYQLDAVNEDGSIDWTILADGTPVRTKQRVKWMASPDQRIVGEEPNTELVRDVIAAPIDDPELLDRAIQFHLDSYVAGIEASAPPVVAKEVTAMIGKATAQSSRAAGASPGAVAEQP